MQRWGIGVAMLILQYATAAFGGWEAVQRIPPDQKINVITRAGAKMGGSFVTATETGLVLRSKSGEESIGREDIVAVRVADPSSRMRRGVIGTAIGAGVGLGLSYPVCERIYNEGGNRSSCVAGITAPFTGGGAALGFLPTPYRLVYEAGRPASKNGIGGSSGQ
jgi:hypothetical protein